MGHPHREFLLALPFLASVAHDLSHIYVLLFEEFDASHRLSLEWQGTRLIRVSKFVDS